MEISELEKSLTETSLNSEKNQSCTSYILSCHRVTWKTLKHRVSDSATLEWGQIICTSNKFPGNVDVDVAGSVTTAGKLLLQRNQSCHSRKHPLKQTTHTGQGLPKIVSLLVITISQSGQEGTSISILHMKHHMIFSQMHH